MSEYRNSPTCEIGFWKPAHAGCPVCGPNGPCHDPQYESLIQQTKHADKRRRIVARVALAMLLLGLVCLLLACAPKQCPIDDVGGYERCERAHLQEQAKEGRS